MKFEHLAGKRALGSAQAKDYTDWAVSLLCEGCDSESVAILAGIGLDKETGSEEIEKYFQKSLKELALSLPPHEESLRIYAEYLCKQIVAGELEPEKGLSILEAFYSCSNYDEPIYSIWDTLGEDVWSVNNRFDCTFNSDLTRENLGSYIRDVAGLFLRLTKVELPKNLFSMYLCQKCGYLGEHALEQIDKPWLPEKLYRFFYRRGPTYRSVCAKCREPYPKSMSNFEGLKLYLDQR
ncbi:hypothetical protein F6V25_08095 [Oryzomonas japonica]|uniref:Uncharacterized protein n=1 Tax=Oryzomonas japonica TaxID=2603858 RepID=A0A7J4ZR59_9BACT|nr:hypothetical protein [Oryzomonas japonica]KAB0665672.1 hypothetical protein F6V25_08095 [Oryzomonas japonica]